MTKRCLLMLVCALLAGACLMPARADDLDLIGQADLIALGAVTTVTTVPDAPAAAGGQATFHVDRLLKGVPDGDTVSFRYVAPAARHGQQMLCPLLSMAQGQQLLFFLQRAPYGYTPVQGDLGVQAAEKADLMAKLIAAFPVEVAVEKPVGPFFFGKPASVQLKITNRGADPLRYADIRLEGFYASPRISETLRFTEVPSLLMNSRAHQPVIPAGGTQSARVQISTEQPESWRLFTSDTYLQTVVVIRAVVSAQSWPDRRRETPAPFLAASPWVNTTTGFPLPEAPATVTPALPKVDITPLLAPIGSADPAARATVLKALLKEAAVNPAVIAVMKKETEQRRAKLALTANGGQLLADDETTRLMLEVDVLQQALLEAEWGMDPAERITAWVHAQKFADDQAFTRECMPMPIMHDSLTALFPGYRFYFADFPGYFGGAVPTQEMLRRFQVPPPLEEMNLIAIKRDGAITLLNTLKSREAFFRDTLPPVKSAAQARTTAAAWLRLTQVFVRNMIMQPAFALAPTEFPVATLKSEPPQLEVTGKAVVIPGTEVTGDITVQMRFTEDGKLVSTTELQQVAFPMISPPP